VRAAHRAVGAKLPFGDLIAYAKHHNLPQEVIDVLQDLEEKAEWLCLAGTEYGASAFTDALQARERTTVQGLVLYLVPNVTSGRHASSSATR
jgi:Protein of unknown function (DUF2795)